MKKQLKKMLFRIPWEWGGNCVLHWLLFVLILLPFSLGCVPVASYQKMYLNDEEMALKERLVETGEINAMSYREGAAGAIGGKSGGGCGCN